jgi:hypothetical protein
MRRRDIALGREIPVGHAELQMIRVRQEKSTAAPGNGVVGQPDAVFQFARRHIPHYEPRPLPDRYQSAVG